MATVRKIVETAAAPSDVWAAIRDVGALHTRLVPGFVVATTLEPGARIVTFASGLVVREPIVTLDEDGMRLVWTAEGIGTTHYNGAVAVFAAGSGGSQVVWTADFLPDAAQPRIDAAMTAGAEAMAQALARLGDA